ncbi:MAG: glutamate--tRNA ligase family protein, partial [Alphaproteobacteria bacterium]
MPVTPVITRFAPSPTGALHLGHAYAALVAWRAARQAGGRFLVRLEDIDGPRMRPAYVQAILDDLTWLGLPWDGEVLRQSTRMAAYKAALDRLAGMDLLYPCFCTRAEIRAEIDRAGSAPHPAAGREGSAGDGSGDGMTPPYPGTCRALAASERAARLAAGEPHALRLPMDQALAKAGPHLVWHDRRRGEQVADPAPFGDIVLARKDIP